MKQYRRKQVTILLLILLTACSQPERQAADTSPPVFEIAFMPDVHFHDLFAEFEPGSFDGLPVLYRGEEKQAVIRTMEAQLNSTRLFNENYFAFLAALDDIAGQGIKYVALPGDFSDDGQPAHIRGLAEILNQYHEEHGISFFLTPGNHDPTRPFATEAGKRDYLGEGGRRQPVFSRNHPICTESNSAGRGDQAEDLFPESHSAVCTDDVKELGYSGLYDILGKFGLTQQETYLYYETPFSDGEYLADKWLMPENRMYEVCHEGAGGEYKEPHFTNCFDVPDMSYLVEPAEGVWLLALDTNVYVPRADADQKETENGENFQGSGNAGYNKVITHKKHLLPWMADVARRAEEQGKMLISFSHFPAADFYNGAGPLIKEVWGENEFQMARMPDRETTQAVAASDVRLHVAGHMHMNGLQTAKDEESGKVLTNIQVPSLAAYVPAYKIVRTFKDRSHIEIETVVLDEVPDFDTLFPLYEEEWNYLDSIGYDRIWNRWILESSNYHGFTDWHIRELSRLRFLPGEWPDELREVLENSTGRHLLVASQLPAEEWLEKSWPELKSGIDEAFANDLATGSERDPFRLGLKHAEERLRSEVPKMGDFEGWDGNILSTDFYRIRNAGELALRHIPANRVEQYEILADAFTNRAAKGSRTASDNLLSQIEAVFTVMSLFADRLPGDHAVINLETGDVLPIVE
ncbi:MAG: metallophosphoesterase [Balneolaceae bacterium]